MPLRPSERLITISSSPVTVTLAIRMNELSPVIANNQTDVIQTYVIAGTHVQAGNISIVPNATGVATGITFRFYYIADVTLGANTFQIFGYSMTAQQLLQNSVITARYNGSAWDVVLNSSFTENDIVATNHIIDLNVTTAKLNTASVTTIKIADANVTTAKILDANITTSKIADLNVTSAKLAADSVITSKILDANVTGAKIADGVVTNAKLANLTQGSLKIGDASNLVSDLAIGADTYVLKSNGTTASWVDPNSLPISNVVKYATLTIPTASVLTLNSVPLTIVAAQGSGKSIVVVQSAVQMVYNSVAYATNTTLQLLVSTATVAQVSATSYLAAAATRFWLLPTQASGAANTSVVSNQPLTVTVATGDPTAGDSPLVVHVWYIVLE